MSTLSDRLLILVVAATALGGMLWWVGGYIWATLSGTTRWAFMVAAIALYGIALVAIWLEFAHLDHTAESEGA